MSSNTEPHASAPASIECGPRWPLWLWGLQLIPGQLLFAYLFWLLMTRASLLSTIALLGVLAWCSIVLGVLVTRRGRTWLIRWRTEWCLVAGSAALVLLALDIALTVFGIVPTIEQQRARSLAYTFGPFGTYRLVPKTIAVDDGSEIQINSRGFRGELVTVEKRPGQRRILFLGGSQVFDYNGGGWPARAGALLVSRGYDVDVVNASVPGYTTVDSLATLLTDAWMLAPDIIFLCQTWNDIKYFARVDQHQPYRGLPPDEPKSWHKDWRLYPEGLDRVFSLSALYRRVRWGLINSLITEEAYDAYGSGIDEASADKAVLTDGYGVRQYEMNLRLIAELSDAIGARLVICKQAHLSQRTARDEQAIEAYVRRNTGLTSIQADLAFEACNDAIDRIATRYGLEIVDMRPLQDQREHFKDAVHFSASGSRSAATLVADALAPRLDRAP